eukprot:scaffold62767_cov64-Phaeocystis_antarctica.AAC.2
MLALRVGQILPQPWHGVDANPRRVDNVVEGENPTRTPQRLEVARRQPVAVTAVNEACPRRGPHV